MNNFSDIKEVMKDEMISRTTNKRYLSKEIATRQNSEDFFGNLFNYLPNPDPILKALGKDIEAYEELSYDSRVKACTGSRKSAVKSMEWDVIGDETPDKEIQFHKDYLKKWKMKDIISELLDGALYGYKPAEILWKHDGQYLIPYNLVGKPCRWFTYDVDNNLLFKSKTNMFGDIVPVNQFVVARNSPTYNNPFGDPAYSGCYWPVVFRRNGWRFWTMYVEKYGMPFLMAHVKDGTKKGDIKDVNDMLALMFQDACATVWESTNVEMLQSSSGKEGLSAHPPYMDACNTEIAMSLLGQNLSTEVKGGSYAATEGHLEVRDDITDSDADELVSEPITEVVQIAHRLNFASSPPEFKLFSEEKIETDRADRDEKIQRGNPNFKFKKEYYTRKYNLQDDEFELTEGEIDGNGGGGNEKD